MQTLFDAFVIIFYIYLFLYFINLTVGGCLSYWKH